MICCGEGRSRSDKPMPTPEKPPELISVGHLAHHSIYTAFLYVPLSLLLGSTEAMARSYSVEGVS